MSIKETVKQALSNIKGNCGFYVFGVHDIINDESITVGQVSRALRDIPYVKRSNGRYVIKGRRVSDKTGKQLIKYRCDVCHKWSTRIDQSSGLCEHCASKRAIKEISNRPIDELRKAA